MLVVTNNGIGSLFVAMARLASNTLWMKRYRLRSIL